MASLDSDAVYNEVGQRIPRLELSWVDRTDSTNEEMRRLADGGAPEWSVLVAGEQTGGRGRHGRSWASPPGGLYLSVLLRQWEDPATPVTLIPLLTGLALQESLRQLTVERGAKPLTSRLKWPNDLITQRGKLAGILCETSLEGSLWGVIVGVGVNLQPLDTATRSELTQPVTSLGEEAPRRSGQWQREEVLGGFLIALARERELYLRDPAALREKWLHASGMLGQAIKVNTGRERLTGIFRGLGEAGSMLLERDGEMLELNAAEGLEWHDNEQLESGNR